MDIGVQFEQQKQCSIMTLVRSATLNALDLPMIKAMQAHLTHCLNNPMVQMLVLQAKPGKAFCAGGDVRWLYEQGKQHNPEQLQFFLHEYRLNYAIKQFTKPYISFLNGITMGGGVGVSLHGAFTIASDAFSFAMPETGIGLFPDVGASYLLSRCPGQLGRYLGLTGQRLNADDALAAGLITHKVPEEAFPLILNDLDTLDLSSRAHEQIRDCLTPFSLSAKPESAITDFDKINRYFSGDSLAQIMAALEASDDPWAISTKQRLLTKSPLSLAITFLQLERAATMSLADCLKMDYCLVKHFMAGKDFYEGIRALLIDKDKEPRWQPLSLMEVTESMIANYFECDNDELLL